MEWSLESVAQILDDTECCVAKWLCIVSRFESYMLEQGDTRLVNHVGKGERHVSTFFATIVDTTPHIDTYNVLKTLNS
jgi:hypothetical protein